MVKKLLLLIPLLYCLFQLKAQTQNNVRLAIETGFLPLSADTENLGLFLNVEPKIEVLENTFFGLRIGLNINSHTFINNHLVQFRVVEEFDNAIFSFGPTLDYYFNENYYRPFIGLGIGYHLQPHPIEVFQIRSATPSEDILDGSVNERIGFLVRGGLEINKLRLGVEYNFIPTADIEIRNSQIIGSVSNNYFGLSIGLIIGVGKS